MSQSPTNSSQAATILKECGAHRLSNTHLLCRDMRERYLETYDDAHSDTPPFSDLFIGEVRSPAPLYILICCIWLGCGTSGDTIAEIDHQSFLLTTATAMAVISHSAPFPSMECFGVPG